MKSHRAIIPVWSAVFLLFAATPCRADARAEFDKAYTIYHKHVDNREWARALTSAEDAYYLGVRAFDEASINTGNLGFNYGRLLNRFERFEEAQRVLTSTLHVHQVQYGDDSTKLIDVLVELGKASWSPQYERTSGFETGLRSILSTGKPGRTHAIFVGGYAQGGMDLHE